MMMMMRDGMSYEVFFFIAGYIVFVYLCVLFSNVGYVKNSC